MNDVFARMELKRLMQIEEPSDADSLDGFLASLAILLILALGIYVAGVMVLIFLGR